MALIAPIVESIIRRRPILGEAIARGIINYGALAALLLPEVEKTAGNKVKHATVMMALRRLREKRGRVILKDIPLDTTSSIIIQEDLVEITVEKNRATMGVAKSLFEKACRDFLTVTQGVYEVTYILKQHHKKEFINLFKKEDIVMVIDHLSSVTITLPLEMLHTPGFFSFITKEMAWENINIIEIVSTLKELTFIVKADDASRVFTTIKRLMGGGA